MRSWVPFSAALAPLALVGGWTVGAALQPDTYDSVRDTISALAAQGAEQPWVMTTGLVLVGGAHLATALGLKEARMPGRVILGIGGVATILVAVFAQPSGGHQPVAAPPTARTTRPGSRASSRPTAVARCAPPTRTRPTVITHGSSAPCAASALIVSRTES